MNLNLEAIGFGNEDGVDDVSMNEIEMLCNDVERAIGEFNDGIGTLETLSSLHTAISTTNTISDDLVLFVGPAINQITSAFEQRDVETTCEAISDVVKKAWANIKKFLMSIWDKIKSFFAKITKATKIKRKKAKKQKEEIDTIIDANWEELEHELGIGAASKIHGDTTEFDKVFEDTKKWIDNLASTVDEAIKDGEDNVVKSREGMESALAALKTVVENDSERTKVIVDKPKIMASNIEKEVNAIFDEVDKMSKKTTKDIGKAASKLPTDIHEDHVTIAREFARTQALATEQISIATQHQMKISQDMDRLMQDIIENS